MFVVIEGFWWVIKWAGWEFLVAVVSAAVESQFPLEREYIYNVYVHIKINKI
jgi:hypothetical protein